MKFYLSCIILFFYSCVELSNETYTHLDPNEKRKLSDQYVSLANKIESGSPKNMRILEKAARINPENEQAYQRLSYPYLYRGLYEKWNECNQKVIDINPKAWQGSRGGTKLFYFRDYGGALSDFEFSDTLKTETNEYIQNQSIDYLKALCYLGLKNYKSGKEFLEKYIQNETTKSGSKFIDQTAYIYLSIINLYYQDYSAAIAELNKATKFAEPFADVYYFRAKAHFMKGNIQAAKNDIEKAKALFEDEIFNKAIYYEVPFQIYLYDINTLQKDIECFL